MPISDPLYGTGYADMVVSTTRDKEIEQKTRSLSQKPGRYYYMGSSTVQQFRNPKTQSPKSEGDDRQEDQPDKYARPCTVATSQSFYVPETHTEHPGLVIDILDRDQATGHEAKNVDPGWI